MDFTALEVSFLHNAIVFSANKDGQGSPQARTFPLGKLKDASSACKKIEETVSEDKQKFIDGKIEFTTDEKKILLDCIDSREWPATGGGTIIEVKEKLSK